MSGVLKRFLENVAEAAERGAKEVARGGEEIHGWVKSGEARKALGKLGRDAADVAREAREALAEGAQEAGAAVQEGVQALRDGFRGGGGTGGARGEGGAADDPARAAEGTQGEEQLSEDDRAALRARQRAAGATAVVRCTHCDAEVQVPADAELAKCSACGRRFWIELADRD